MTYATEFFAVQNALGIENASNVTATPFANLDAEFKSAGRLEDEEKEIEGFGLVRAIFVDGKMVVCKVDGEDVEADAAEVRDVLGL